MIWKDRCGLIALGSIGISIIISIVFATVVSILFAIGAINILISTWVVLGLGILLLLITIVGSFLGATTRCSALSKCLCTSIPLLLLGSIGTILSTLAIISVGLTGLLALFILVPLAAFFFALMILALIRYIHCIVCRVCDK